MALGKWCIGPQKRSPQDSRDGIFLYSAQASFSLPRLDLARLLRRACSKSFWIISFEFVKVFGIHFSIWESFIGFYICCYPIFTILACSFSVGVRISRKKLCWKGAWRRKWHLVSPTLNVIIVYRVNLNKLSRNFVGALRTTTTNCRVSFIDLYLVFPRNFRIVFSPHTNTVVLLELYCGTITEPGLPVDTSAKHNASSTYSLSKEQLECFYVPFVCLTLNEGCWNTLLSIFFLLTFINSNQ